MLDAELAAGRGRGLPRRHPPAAGRRPGAAAEHRPGPGARRPRRLRASSRPPSSSRSTGRPRAARSPGSATAVRGGELPAVDDPEREVVIVPSRDSTEAARRVVQLVTDSIPRALGHRQRRHPGRHPGAPRAGGHRGAEPGAEGGAQSQRRCVGAGQGTQERQPGTPVRRRRPHRRRSPTTSTRASPTARSARSPPAPPTGWSSRFSGAPVTVPPTSWSDLRHGWAITVHRAQGSEWPAVVVVLPPESGGLLTRPLVYTALTRAQRHLSVVPAVGGALARAVRENGGRPRVTRLPAPA